jgi:fucose 4-O-acetylase-like acetyltransferase
MTLTEAPAPLTAARAVTEAPPAQPKSRVRTPLWDNARFVAITLVIVGHATLELISKSDPAYSVYLFVYLFHVPVFVAVSGHFAQSSRLHASDLRKLIRQLVVPYLVFETIWTGIHWAISGTLSLDYTTAWWTLWFLVALVVWRLLLPLLVALRFPMTISLVLSVAAGYVGGLDDRFALARTLGLLPFFVLGWKLKQWGITERWMALPPVVVWRVRAVSIAVFGVAAAVIAANVGLWRDLLIRRFMLYDEDYGSFGYEQWWAGAVRLLFIGIAVILCFAFLTLMPRTTTPLTALGQATLYIYLLHSFVLYPIRESSWFQDNTSLWVLVAAIGLSVALPFVLGSRVVQRLVRPLVEPRMDWLFRKTEPRLPAAAEGLDASPGVGLR